jgi:hypothetical protein
LHGQAVSDLGGPVKGFEDAIANPAVVDPLTAFAGYDLDPAIPSLAIGADDIGLLHEPLLKFAPTKLQ